MIAIAGAHKAFNEDGSLVNERYEQSIIETLNNLVKLGKQLKINPE